MSLAVTVGRIRGVLQAQFDDHIDMSDWSARPAEQVESAFLSRALAALCVKSYAGVDAETASAALVDGFDDGGIDAIHFDAPNDVLYFVQSKWSSNGNVGFDEGDVSKFINGVGRVLNAEFERFNAKVRAKEAEIKEALYADREVRIRLLTVHTSKQAMAPHVKRVVEAFTAAVNDPVQIADHFDIDQAGAYELITSESRDPKIKLSAVLNDWGQIDQPYLSYYGRVSHDQIVEWWKAHRNKLFSQNLRLYYQNSAVNDALRRTISDDPESFWYFNNGITIIADKVIRGIAGTPAHKFGNFTCEGASVVNGAQTVGTIGSAADAVAMGGDRPEGLPAWVQVRLISLERTPPDFSRRITRAANLQNAVGTREFAAMDPLQHRLAIEFALDKRRYVYKSGESDPRGEEGCSLIEATQALGCAHSVRLAVEVKREIGSIWADTDKAPYADIFYPALTADRVWRAVTVMRTTDELLHAFRASDAPRADLVGAHLSRVILHLVFQDADVKAKYLSTSPLTELIQAARSAAGIAAEKVSAYLKERDPNGYPATFAKNYEKCAEMVQVLTSSDPPALRQGDFFRSDAVK